MPLDAVLPLTARDLPRAMILRASMDRHFRGLRRCWVVVPDRDRDAARRAFADPYAVVPESAVAPELRRYRRVGRIRGWFLQQLVKLAITPWIGTEFYLTLDADVICAKPTRADGDLIRDGRALTFPRYRSALHAEWYAWAERVLGMRRSGFVHGVTPALLNVEAVTLLQRHLEGRAHPLLRRLGRGGWRGYLLRHLPWTEYALYFTFLESMGLYDRYHVEGDGLCGGSVWFPEQFAAWAPPSEAHFTVVQSTAVGTEALAARLRQTASFTPADPSGA